MCGIAGIFEYGRANGSITPELLARMRDTLRHRGPDDAGSYISPDLRVGLGMRRLAIVDIAGGAQPMFGENGEVLVFNGEIYNYPRLRKKLEEQGVPFRTDCDTEVVLRLYELHGDECVHLLNGMFAFALWDPSRGRLYFARDRVGEKPFYWTQRGGRFMFASEIKALLEHPSVGADVCEDAIPEYLANLVTSSPRTLYKDIYKLAPGEFGWCDRSGVHISRYWDLFKPTGAADCSLEEAASNVRRLLDASVHDRLMSDVPVGVLLSGGLDSTTLVALLRERAKGLATFSVGFDDYPLLDERREARLVAEHFRTDHHEVTVSQRDGLDFLTRLIYHQDEPLADPVCIPLYFVCELAQRRGVKVVLAGEGADELFWGYPRYRTIIQRSGSIERILALPDGVRRTLPHLIPPQRAQVRELLEHLATGRPLPMHMPLGMPLRHRQKILHSVHDELSAGWAPSPARTSLAADPDWFTRLAYDTQEYEFGLRLPELLLMRIDRFSMANSIEARVPFLDPDLVEFVYRLPIDQKFRDGRGKVVLREAIGDIVPEWVMNRKKQGFAAPVDGWLQSQLGTVFERLIETEGVRRYFQPDVLRVALRNAKGGRGRPRMSLWPVVNFALWHHHWIENKSIESLVVKDSTSASREKAIASI
jgi:asparagine synthase (glutamine-hydrolysing)